MRHADVRHVVDARLDPILVWRVDGVPADDDIARLLPGRLVVIDARCAVAPSAAQLERLRAIAVEARGIALVVPSPSLRRALLHIPAWRTLPPPHVVSTNMADAMLWAEAQLLRAAA